MLTFTSLILTATGDTEKGLLSASGEFELIFLAFGAVISLTLTVVLLTLFLRKERSIEDQAG